jgi:hypothetical protein
VNLLERHQMAYQVFAHRQYLTQHGGSLNRHGFTGEGAGARQQLGYLFVHAHILAEAN